MLPRVLRDGVFRGRLEIMTAADVAQAMQRKARADANGGVDIIDQSKQLLLAPPGSFNSPLAMAAAKRTTAASSCRPETIASPALAPTLSFIPSSACARMSGLGEPLAMESSCHARSRRPWSAGTSMRGGTGGGGLGGWLSRTSRLRFCPPLPPQPAREREDEARRSGQGRGCAERSAGSAGSAGGDGGRCGSS